MKTNYIKGELNEEVKQAILNDADLARKIIDAWGGEVSLAALLQRVNRNSSSLTKKSVLNILSEHLNIPVKKLFRSDKVETINH